MTISDTYRLSLKPREVEEWTDLFVYRPLGFLFAVPLVRTPVTPNMVTFCFGTDWNQRWGFPGGERL